MPMTKHAHATVTPAASANTGMKMSPDARLRMRRRERDVFNYYDDMGPGKGNCTWGPGILAHKGPCTKEELASPVSGAAVEAEFSRRVAEAEAGVIGHVRKQKLPQDQFDALVSLTYNAGVHGSRNVYTLVDTGRPAEAATKIRSMTSTHVNGKKVLARGLISRRAEESAPFQEAAKAAAVAKK
jgi:GH24 family phage-related lysozyme (muramidase)